MKQFLLWTVLCTFASVQLSCNHQTSNDTDGFVKRYYLLRVDTLLAQLDTLTQMVSNKSSVEELQQAFARSRFTYKKIEGITEYYFQGLTRRINGPALPDVKVEDGVVWSPHGFQVIEQLLFGDSSDSSGVQLINEISVLQTDLRYTRSNLQNLTVSPNHLTEIVQHQFIRIAALGITGFDTPLSKLSIAEAKYSLLGVEALTQFFEPTHEIDRRNLLSASIAYLDAHPGFDIFNQMEFIRSYLVPLSRQFTKAHGFDSHLDSIMDKPFRGGLADLLSGKGFSGDYYANYDMAKSNPAKLELGRKLFFSKQLSQSLTMSCASCHQPDLYFTDGRPKAVNFSGGGSLLRNTPSLYYAAMQSHQFYDMRSVALEDQAHEVMRSQDEFHLSSSQVASRLGKDEEYRELFQSAFGQRDTISGYEVRNALGAFVRTLAPFSSAFDRYMNGDSSAMSAEQVRGFNLFAGKAKCATCHFIPLFNGNIPPFYTKSESEVIGVPLEVKWTNARIDGDSGRYMINRFEEFKFAFKTPTVRNTERTAPYMHNGVYQTLDDVVEFYHRGGGVGIGIDLPHQTLPFDSLILDASEKNAIVAFMKSLTDGKYSSNNK